MASRQKPRGFLFPGLFSLREPAHPEPDREYSTKTGVETTRLTVLTLAEEVFLRGIHLQDLFAKFCQSRVRAP